MRPLYTEAPATDLLDRSSPVRPFRICMRRASQEDVDGGADALWLARGEAADGKLFAVIDTDDGAVMPPNGVGFVLNHDPLARRARGEASFETLAGDLEALGLSASRFEGEAITAVVSTLVYHDAGADAADELAFALSTGARYLQALLDGGVAIDVAAGRVALQVSVGRDTFLELTKLRALRACWEKLLVASGVEAPARALVHAVCSSRTLTVRDPWVNMLRVTTQVFSALLVGALLVSPVTLEEASGAPSAFGLRVARNTGLVLREESFLGRVHDPAGGSYYLESLTSELAREAWKRFQKLEGEGGIARALESGALFGRLDAAWKERLAEIAKRKVPIVGVSDFANLDESLPRPLPSVVSGPRVHRDAEAFEALRARADAGAPDVALVTLGTLAESRTRAGFAANFFAAGGFRTHETTADESAPIACLCGTDERYAAEAVARVETLKAAGSTRVLLAGRPGTLESALREAGIDGFIFAGCDVVATLDGLLEVSR